MTHAPTKQQAEQALAALRRMFGEGITTDMEMERVDEGDGERCLVTWNYGPFQWSYVSPEFGGIADGFEIPPATNWPEGVWKEAKSDFQITLWTE